MCRSPRRVSADAPGLGRRRSEPKMCSRATRAATTRQSVRVFSRARRRLAHGDPATLILCVLACMGACIPGDPVPVSRAAAFLGPDGPAVRIHICAALERVELVETVDNVFDEDDKVVWTAKPAVEMASDADATDIRLGVQGPGLTTSNSVRLVPGRPYVVVVNRGRMSQTLAGFQLEDLRRRTLLLRGQVSPAEFLEKTRCARDR